MSRLEDHSSLLENDDPFESRKYLIADKEMGFAEILTSEQLYNMPAYLRKSMGKGCLIVPFDVS